VGVAMSVVINHTKTLYLHGIGQIGAHPVAGGHDLRKGLRTLELWIDQLEATHTCLYCDS